MERVRAWKAPMGASRKLYKVGTMSEDIKNHCPECEDKQKIAALNLRVKEIEKLHGERRQESTERLLRIKELEGQLAKAKGGELKSGYITVLEGQIIEANNLVK